MEARRRFQQGELFTHQETFPEGLLQLQAMVLVDREARTVLLWDVELGPVSLGRIEIGPLGVLAFFASICRLAAAEGYDTLVVCGYRTGGANPERSATVSFNCRQAVSGTQSA